MTMMCHSLSSQAKIKSAPEFSQQTNIRYSPTRLFVVSVLSSQSCFCSCWRHGSRRKTSYSVVPSWTTVQTVESFFLMWKHATQVWKQLRKSYWALNLVVGKGLNETWQWRSSRFPAYEKLGDVDSFHLRVAIWVWWLKPAENWVSELDNDPKHTTP